MKKRLFVTALMVTAVLGLAACGGKKNQEKVASGEPAAIGEPESGEAEGETRTEVETKMEGESEGETKTERESEGETKTEGESEAEGTEEIELHVFIAASLNRVMEEIIMTYQADHPEVNFVCNTDSSGTLLAQIEEGCECDIFFSAAQKQMDQLEEDGLLVEGTRKNIVNNQLVVVAGKDSGTAVKGLENLGDAESIALAGGSVPAGRYTRQALMNLGILEKTDDPASIGTSQVSKALGGVEISEQTNVSMALLAVVEGSCEVGTTYYSDTYGYEDRLDILEKVSCELTGDVVYPAAQVVNLEAGEKQAAAARDFLEFLLSDRAKELFEKYYFDASMD